MHELSQEEFYKAKPLLEDGFLHPEIISIIEHNNPGWIFVDQRNDPQSALVWSKGIEGFYLIGDHTNEDSIYNLDNFIRRIVEPRMRELSLTYFEVSGHHNKWNLESIFKSRNLFKFQQLVMQLMSKPRVKCKNDIKTINLNTLEWTIQDYVNTELIDSHIRLFWSSHDDFKKKGYGYAAVYGKEIIGVCYSSFVTQNIHAIGIETVPHFQSMGIGAHLASLLVEEIYRNGFSPYWDCSHDNEPSKKLAERLGFNLTHQYTGVGFEI